RRLVARLVVHRALAWQGAGLPEPAFHGCETWQCNTVEPFAWFFHMHVDFAGFVPMVGRDAYVLGHGSMRGKLLGLVSVADGRGDAFNVGEHTNVTSLTASSDACGKTNKEVSNILLIICLEMGVSDSPVPLC